MEYVIPHYGDFALLRRAVDSINQTDAGALIYIGDDTRSLRTDQFNCSNVTIVPGPGKGFASNVNRLVNLTKGEWITIMNNDVELDRSWWPQMAEAIAAHGRETFSIASTVLRPNGRIDSLGDAISWYGVGFNRHHLKPVRTRYLKPTPILGATGGLATVRRAVFVNLGGYSELLQSYCEDTQLNLRATAVGYRSWYHPSARAFHRGTATFTMGKKLYQSARNSILYIRTDCGGSFRRVLLRRVTAYWRLKALLSRTYRADIRAGITAGYQTPITPSKIVLYGWPEGNFREGFWQTQWRLGWQTVATVLHRLRLLRAV